MYTYPVYIVYGVHPARRCTSHYVISVSVSASPLLPLFAATSPATPTHHKPGATAMPGVIRRLLIVATADGLILQPHGHGHTHGHGHGHGHGHVSRPSTDETPSSSSIRIEYKTSKVTLFPTGDVSTSTGAGAGAGTGTSPGTTTGGAGATNAIEAYGLVGTFPIPWQEI